MLEFSRITLEDKGWIEPCLVKSGMLGSEYTFSNNYIYRKIYQIDVARMNGYYVVRSGKDGMPRSFLFPAGEGDVFPVLECMRQDAKKRGEPFCLHNVPKTALAVLESLYPGQISAQETRDSFDYLYESEKLISLAGKKLHSKRNFVNRFQGQNQGNWHYEEITPQNIDIAWEMNVKWCRIYGCSKGEGSLLEESCAVRNCFNHFQELGLLGGILFVGQEAVAYTMGRPINHEAFVIHIEKAMPDVAGAYPTINQQFAARNCGGYRFINREEDVGDEGLRKAKLSYKPAILLEKYKVQFHGE